MDMKQNAHMVTHTATSTANALLSTAKAGAMAVRVRMRRFKRDERGNFAMMFALLLPALIGIAALGIDVGIWFKDRRELQTIVDAAAVAAAIENYNGATQAEIAAAAQLEANRNGFDPTTDQWVLADGSLSATPYAGPPTSGAYSGAAYMEVRITRQLETILSQVYFILDPTTTARAVAGTTADQEACVLALSPTASPALSLSGNANVTMTGCGVVSNSATTSYSVSACNNCNLTADCVWAAGGINDGVSSITTTQCSAPVSNSKPADDPFAGLANPTIPPSCTAGTAMSGAKLNISTTMALTPGRYCQGLKITGGDITMAPGTYYMDTGDFEMTGGTLVGTGVTIVLTSSTDPAAGTGSIKIAGNGGAALPLTISAPTSGEYNGILFYQDRRANDTASKDSIITGSSATKLSGAVYTPQNDLSFTGSTATDGTGCLMLVGNSISFSGIANVENNCDMYGGNPVFYGATPGLVE